MDYRVCVASFLSASLRSEDARFAREKAFHAKGAKKNEAANRISCKDQVQGAAEEKDY